MIKLIYKEETHNISYIPQKYDELISLIQNLFQNLPKNPLLKYYDHENDKITISNDDDMLGISESVKQIIIFENQRKSSDVGAANQLIENIEKKINDKLPDNELSKNQLSGELKNLQQNEEK